MGNPLKGEVSFEVGELTYRLVFNINTLCTLEDHLDASVAEIAQKLSGEVRLGFLRSVIWAGLQEHHPGLTLKQAGDIIGGIGAGNVGPQITKALASAFGTEAAEGDPDPQPKAARKRRAAGTGSTSSEPGTN